MSRQPIWLDKRAVLLLHDESLAMFGGAPGLRDDGLLDSALGRPVNQYLYDGVRDFGSLAAAYGYGIAKNHAFVDGNKRAAFLAIGVFLALNRRRLVAGQVDAIRTILALAAGTLDERQLADWIRAPTSLSCGPARRASGDGCGGSAGRPRDRAGRVRGR